MFLTGAIKNSPYGLWNFAEAACQFRTRDRVCPGQPVLLKLFRRTQVDEKKLNSGIQKTFESIRWNSINPVFLVAGKRGYRKGYG